MNSNERRVLIEEYNIPITVSWCLTETEMRENKNEAKILLVFLIKVRDLRTLQGLNWLNDEVINFYMGMIVKR